MRINQISVDPDSGTVIGHVNTVTCFFILLLYFSMEKYLLSEPVPIPKPLRWSWFALGCSCLLLGAAYLSVVDISGRTIVRTASDTLVSTEIDE